MDLHLKNKSVVVTGGNRGIGRAIALAFAGEGANVAIVGRDTDALATVKGEIEATGVKGLSIAADLFTAEGCSRAVEETAAHTRIVPLSRTPRLSDNRRTQCPDHSAV